MGKGNAGSSTKVVPITREYSHYLEPAPHAIKRNNGEVGSEFGRYRTRSSEGLVSLKSKGPTGWWQTRPHAACFSAKPWRMLAKLPREGFETGSTNVFDTGLDWD